MYYMTFISRCLGMLKSRNDKLVWAKDELKKYLRHHIIHEYDHIFRLNRHNGTTLVPGHDLICSTWCCGPVAGSHPANLNTTAGKYMFAPSPLLPPCFAHTQTHTNTHKHTQIHTKILFSAKLRLEKSAQVQNTTQLCYVQKWSTWTSSMSEFISLSLQYSPPPHTPLL